MIIFVIAMTPNDLPKYKEHYSENAFWSTVKKIAEKAGVKIIYYALVLYYTLASPDTPNKYRAVIAGALGYMILPLDLMPDFIPFAGLADDWGALVGALAFVASAITPEIKEKAHAKAESVFGKPLDESQLGEID